MKKKAFIAAVAKQAHVTRKEAAQYVDVVFGTIEEILRSGESVSIHGFGTFIVKMRAASLSASPLFGAESVVPAHPSVRFQCGKRLKDKIALCDPLKLSEEDPSAKPDREAGEGR